MKLRNKLVKTAISLSILLIALTITEATVKFAKEYKYVGFEKKDGSAMQIAEEAEGNLSACQIDLTQAKADKDAAIFANNPDLK